MPIISLKRLLNPYMTYGFFIVAESDDSQEARFLGRLFNKGLIAIQFEVYRTTNA